MTQPQAYAVTEGDGLPVVFVHGMGVDHRSLMLLDEAFLCPDNFIPCQGRDPRYNDSVENRTHVEIYQCQSCKFGTSVVSTEEQISHKHPAMRAYDLPRF